jgi:archaellum component FlaD/FlaE
MALAAAAVVSFYSRIGWISGEAIEKDAEIIAVRRPLSAS